jgi:putative aldouronate transport system permease protein
MVKQSIMILRSYGVSFLVTFVGTALSVIITTMLAYPMSRKSFKYRNALAFFVFFTMLFNGGLVPTYLMYTGIFHINNTLLAYIVPGLLMSAMNVMLIRTFFATSIPDALFEAAQIDGASQFQIFFKIVLPLGKPILIAMGLLSGLGYWNDWTNGLYYIRDTKLYGIQNLLNKMISDLTALTQNASGASTVAIADIPEWQ